MGAQTGRAADPKPSLKLQTCVNAGTRKVPFLAEHLKPREAYALKLGGRRIAGGRVRGDGTVGSSFRAPALGNLGQRVRTLAVETKSATVSRRFTTTRFAVYIVPRPEGHSPRDPFRFKVYGFRPGGVIYVHWVRPNGRPRLSRRLGTPKGACGTLVSRSMALFPFSGRLARGTWRLQFDKRRHYSRFAGAPRARLKIPIL